MPMFNERSIQLGIYELAMRFDEDITCEGNICGSHSMLRPPEDLVCFFESARGHSLAPWWLHDGTLSDDHGGADGSGGRNDFAEACRYLRGDRWE